MRKIALLLLLIPATIFAGSMTGGGAGYITFSYLTETITVPYGGDTAVIVFGEEGRYGAGGIDDFELTVDGTPHDLLLYDGEFTDEHSFYIGASADCALIPDADVNQNPDNTDAYWSEVNSALAAGGGIVASSDVDANHYIKKDALLSAGIKYFFSVKAKAGAEDFIYLRILDDVGSKGYYFDLNTGVLGVQVGGATGYISSVDADGYYRCTIVTTIGAVTGANSVFIYSAEADNDAVFTGDDVSVTTYVKDINLMPVWSGTVNSGDVCTLDYDQPTNGAEATTGADLADIVADSVTNNAYLAQTITVPSGGTTAVIGFNGNGKYGAGGIDDFELTVDGTPHDLLLYDGEFTNEHSFFIGDSADCAVIPDADVNQNPDNTDAYWNQTELALIANGGLVADADDEAHYIIKTGLFSAGTKYYLSAKLKAGTEANSVDFARLMVHDDDEYRLAFFDLTNGTVETEDKNDDAGISSIDSDGYYRCWMTFTTTTVTSSNYVSILPAEADADSSFAGDASDVSIYVKDINIMPVWSDTVGSGEVCTLDYDQPTDGAEATSGADLADIVADAVTNNSTQ
jgi:hypothetical protein